MRPMIFHLNMVLPIKRLKQNKKIMDQKVNSQVIKILIGLVVTRTG